MDAVRVGGLAFVVFGDHDGVRAGVRVDCGTVVVQVGGRVEAELAEEGLVPEAEHVEGGHAGGDEADEPEELAEAGWRRGEGLVEDLVLREEARQAAGCRRWRRRPSSWSRR